MYLTMHNIRFDPVPRGFMPREGRSIEQDFQVSNVVSVYFDIDIDIGSICKLLYFIFIFLSYHVCLVCFL
jgi:hypothetical protein